MDLTARDRRQLAGVHPDLVRVIQMAAEQPDIVRFMVLEGLRSAERQLVLVDSGASRTMRSRHLTGHAVDIAPVLQIDSKGRCVPSWHWPHYHQLAPVIKRVADELNVAITWGGDWRRFKDGPHWELRWKSYPSTEVIQV